MKKIVVLRLEEQTHSKIRKQAVNEGKPLSRLVNQILDDYLNWDMTAPKAGWVLVLRDVLIGFLNKIDEETINLVAEKTVDYTKDVGLLMSGAYDLDSYLSILRISSRKSGFKIFESIDKGVLRMIIQHDMGAKWSLFFKLRHELILKKLGHKAICDFTDSTVIFEVRDYGLR